ncbi:hypothetical protein N1851_027361 [Merluccius polli]|uniref:Uncharacterized protein n=1 Tax=Merluccius polli TaxID=89951 RepID=A0AA47NT93_MERPO|nr:hypothetical protein N1851_027361 [Merluccius polli]
MVLWGGVVHQPQGGAVERARESRASSVLDPGEWRPEHTGRRPEPELGPRRRHSVLDPGEWRPEHTGRRPEPELGPRAGSGYFPKTPVSQARKDPRQGKTPSTPGRGPSRRGGRASEQGSGTPAAGSVDRVGECPAAQDHLDKHLAGRLPSGPFPCTSCLRCPAKPSEPSRLWGKSETPSCLLCSGRGSLEHLLSCCPKALADGRYRRRHDQVLKAIAESLASAISSSKHHHAPKKAVPFLKAGEKPRARPQLTTGLLHTASDWQLQVDLGKQLRFPQHIATLCVVTCWRTCLQRTELTVP